jgi:hypothetical protein
MDRTVKPLLTVGTLVAALLAEEMEQSSRWLAGNDTDASQRPRSSKTSSSQAAPLR